MRKPFIYGSYLAVFLAGFNGGLWWLIHTLIRNGVLFGPAAMVRNKNTDNRGFSLIETSAVLVIIGLLAGGILAGQTLLRSSQIQSIIVDVNSYKRAAAQFKQQFNALPGDMANATSFWGTNPSCATNGAGTGKQTCNGDGNGQVASSQPTIMEILYFWQHLSNAGLIQGTYSGSTTSAPPYFYHIAGSNCPASRVAGGAYAAFFVGVVASDGTYFSGTYGHVIQVGAQDIQSQQVQPYRALLTAAEAQVVDSKMDDGKPATGNVVATTLSNCVSSSNHLTATYSPNNVGPACSLLFITAF